MMTPLVSIIVPVYNVEEKFLIKCIKSLINQSLKEIEIILIDDGSTDQSGEICDRFAQKDGRIRVIHKLNGGLCSARNAGCLAAKGEWITFVDGDDWIEPNMCRIMYQEGEKHNVQLVMCSIVKDYGKQSIKYEHSLEDGKVYSKEGCKWLQKQVLVYNAQIGAAYAKLIKREILIEHQILHDVLLKQGAEGVEFNLRLFDKIEKAIFINQFFYHYIYNNTSISTTHDEENHKYVLKCFEKIKTQILEKENKDELLPWLYNRLLYVIITTAISGYFNPGNHESYRLKKKKYAIYLKQPIIVDALKEAPRTGLSFQRKIVLFFIQHHCYFVLYLLGHLRKKQKEYK